MQMTTTITAAQVKQFGKNFAKLFEKPIYRDFAKKHDIRKWSKGLCYMTVRALKLIFGDMGEVWVIAKYEVLDRPEDWDWPLQHFVLHITGTYWFLDSDGACEREQVIPKMYGKHLVSGKVTKRSKGRVEIQAVIQATLNGKPHKFNERIRLAPRKGFKRLWTGTPEMPWSTKVVRQLVDDGRKILADVLK